MSKNMIWLSYDLGISGDYESMYAWLDDQGAKECNSSLAFFRYSYEDDLLESLEQEIRNAININKRSRIYVVFREDGKNQRTLSNWKSEKCTMDWLREPQ